MFKSKYTLILFFLLTVIGLLWGGYRLNYPYPNDPYKIYIYQLNNVKTILKQLEDDRMIFSARLVSWTLTLTGYDKKLQKGIYEINNRMGTYKILQTWLSGDQKIIAITIKEGDDIFDVGKTLLDSGMITNEKDWIRLVKSPEILRSTKNFLGFSTKTKIHTLEGFLYPNTYYLFAGNSPVKLIDLALKEFQAQNKEILLTHQLTEEYKLSVFKMASLVEKETQVLQEKPLIASVIYNRLKIKMKLRFDPTIIYSLKTSGQYYANFKDGFINIKKEHYNLVSPYNTYYIKGLPLTPISSFSVSSLKAVLNPSKTDYLFFVAKKKGHPEEGHFFSSNYKDHLKYLNRMLKRK